MRNWLTALVVGVLSVVWSAAALAQGMPQKPGPEHAKLEYFVGKWTGEGSVSATPFGPGGKTSSMDACEWFEGKFAVVCRYEGKGPTGPMKGIGIMGYSADQKVYTYYGLDNTAMTMTSVARGTISGDVWTYTDEAVVGGQKIASRYILTITSPDTYTFKWEMRGADGKWSTVGEGKSTRVKSATSDE